MGRQERKMQRLICVYNRFPIRRLHHHVARLHNSSSVSRHEGPRRAIRRLCTIRPVFQTSITDREYPRVGMGELNGAFNFH